MRARRVFLLRAAGLAGVLGLGASFWALELRTPALAAPTLPQRGGGVQLGWAASRLGPAGVDDARDFLLETDRLRLVVGNDGAGMERHQRYGSLLELGRVSTPPGELRELRAVLYVGGAQLPLRMLGMDVKRAAGRPVLVVEEGSRDGRFKLSTEYRLEPGQDYAELATTVTNVSGSRVAVVQVGDRALWPGTAAFAPRLGYVHVATRADVPWLGRAEHGRSFGFAFAEGHAQTSFKFDVTGPEGEVVLADAVELEPGGKSVFRRDVIAVDGGLGKLAEVAWRRGGKPLGFVRGSLHPPQTWATISARHPDGRTVLSVAAAPDGSFELPLPAGDYRFVLQAPGGEDEASGSVRADAELPLNLVPPRPGTLSYLITDEQARPLSARLLVRGVAPTKDPDLVPTERDAGSKNMLYSLTGAGALQLPPGRYEVSVTRGPEYSRPTQELEVNAELGATFRAELRRTVDTSGYLAADFHVHASPSHDSNVPLLERVLTLAAEGIELAVPTDHNHLTDYAESIAAQGLGGKLASFPGVEITTLNWGHFNAYPFAKPLEVPETHEASPAEIFAAVRARAPQAVLQVNHPRMPGVGYFNRGELDTKTGVALAPGFSFGFDALEVTNGFDLEDPLVFERNFREWLELLNVGRRYTAVGNSDSHRVVLQWAGWPRTYVRVPDQDPTRVAALDVARALTGGHALVSCGIFVLPTANGTAGPGDTVQGQRVSLAVSLRSPAWIDIARVEVYGNGKKLEERSREPPLRHSAWDLKLELELKVDTALVVLARGEEFMKDALPGKWIKPFGFSNPIYVDADANGAFVAPGR